MGKGAVGTVHRAWDPKLQRRLALKTIRLDTHLVTDEARVLALGLAVARGLAAAHAQCLVHQDLRLENILLGSDGAIKIADSGIAELASTIAQAADSLESSRFLPTERLKTLRQPTTGT